jgi:TPR repeat protein
VGTATESSAVSSATHDHSSRKFAMRIWRAAVLLISAFAMPALAGLKEGLEAAAAKDYERIYREMKPLAEAGNSIAQSYVGWLYAIGKGVRQDDAEAVKWLELAANGNDRRAQTHLGAYYVRGGRGVSTDYRAAMKWYERAAAQGDEDAYLGLADIYERGLGVEADPHVARKWARRAAETDNPEAQYLLALHYWQGRGAGRDHDEAYAWFLRAANQNYVAAMVSLGMMHFGDGRPLDQVTGCTWLELAQRTGPAPKEAERLARTLRERCGNLPSDQRTEIDKRIAHWRPKEVWLERKQREFQEKLRKAAEEDADPMNKPKQR